MKKKKKILWLISMGDLRDWSPEPPNAVVLEERPSSSSSSSSSSNQTAGIGAEYLQRAEEATQGIIAQVQPTVVSENRRRAVTEYVQRLLRNCLRCEVCIYVFCVIVLNLSLLSVKIEMIRVS